MATSLKYLAVFALLALVLVSAASAAPVDVTIHVIDKDGNKIENAEVTLKYSNGTVIDDCDQKEVNSNGRVSCDNVEPNEDVVIEVTHDDYKDIDDDKSLEDFDKDWEDVAVVMRPEEQDLDVTVVDQNGDKIKSADVTVECTEDDLRDSDIDPDDDYDNIVYPDEKSRYEAFEYDESDSSGSDGIASFKNLEYNTEYKISAEKTGYIDNSKDFKFQDKAKDDEAEIELIEPGTADLTATVRDKDSNILIEGATVTVVSRGDGDKKEKQTDGRGEAKFSLDTPECYDIAVTAPNYGQDSVTNECFDNGDDKNMPFLITSQNTAPTADAGEDQFVMVGDNVTLNASGSSDPDGDNLTYSWADSLGAEIPDGASPTVVFDTAGEHVITLTASDGVDTAIDSVTVVVGSPQDCGDNVCSLSEKATVTCPEDCPVCKDNVCGAGERNATGIFYCPLDCKIAADLTMLNDTHLVAGNSTTLSATDPNTGQPIIGAEISIELPNGTVETLTTLAGRADYSFPVAGTYKVTVTSDDYAVSTTNIDIKSAGMDMGWLMWVLLVVVIVILALFLIRFMNMRGGSRGYRAKKYRRGKPSLSRV